ncbi:MAG: hypothetical protein ABI988_10230 [Nitrospirota bacterium]
MIVKDLVVDDLKDGLEAATLLRRNATLFVVHYRNSRRKFREMDKPRAAHDPAMVNREITGSSQR